MAATPTVYQEIDQLIATQVRTRGSRIRITSVRRLALLVRGIVGARSSVLRQIAAEVWAQAAGESGQVESYERRLRRTLNDPALQAPTCYAPVVRAWVDWDAVRAGPEPAVLIVDESSTAEQVHLLRVSLAYRGGSLPLAWRVWRQNVPLPRGAYGAQLRAVLAEAAGIVPPDVAVVVTADRAYDVPLFVDAVAAQGWAWVVRAKARSTLRWRDHQGAEQELRGVLARRVGRPGQRWKAHGQVFKKAGWRAASVVGYWAPGQQEPLVVLTSLPPQWTVLARYGRRFWIEPGFRSDKSKGWHWEDSQITDLTHQERLLLGMAWASLLVLCLGAQAAAAQVQAAAQPGALRPGRPRAARESLFSLGVRWLRRWTYQPTALTPQWRLDALGAPAWGVQWRAVQAQRVLPLPRAAPARPPAAPLSRAA